MATRVSPAPRSTVAAAAMPRGTPATGSFLAAPPPLRAQRTELLLLAGVLVVAAVLRFHQLGAGLWHDEIATLVRVVRAPVLTIVTSFESQNNHPLYSLLAKLSIALFGDSAASLRLPAVLFGLGSIAGVYWLGIHLTRPVEALAAAALLAFSYHHVWFSQNARAYTALLCFALVGTTLLLRLCSGIGRAPRTAVAYAVVMTLAVYSHMTAALIVAGHFAIWGAAALAHPAARRRDVFGAFLLTGMLSVLLYAPGLTTIMSGLGGSGPHVEIAWKNPLWLVTETLRGLTRAVPGGVLVLGLAATAPVAGLISISSRSWFATGLMLMPAVLTAAMLIATGHNLWPRFFFFAAGFAVLFAARGGFVIAARLWPSRAQTVAVAAMLLMLAGSAVLVPRAWGAKQDYAGALAYVEEQQHAGDVVATVGMVGFAYEHYFGTDWVAAEDEAALRALTVDGARTWLVFTMPALIEARTPGLWQQINREFQPARVFPGTLAGGSIHVMVKQ